MILFAAETFTLLNSAFGGAAPGCIQQGREGAEFL